MNNEESILASGYIYIFTDTAFPNCVKVGMSINPVKRLVQYNSDKPTKTTKPLLVSKPFKEVFTVEQRIHKVLNEKLTKSATITSKEWFDIKDIEYITNVLNQAEAFFTVDDTLPLITLDSFSTKEYKERKPYERSLQFQNKLEAKELAKIELYNLVQKAKAIKLANNSAKRVKGGRVGKSKGKAISSTTQQRRDTLDTFLATNPRGSYSVIHKLYLAYMVQYPDVKPMSLKGVQQFIINK